MAKLSKRVKKALLIMVAFLAGGGLFAFLIWRTGAAQTYDSLLAFGVLPCIGFIMISLTNFTLYSWRWKLITDDISPTHKLSLGRFFLHRMSGYAAGYLTPASQVAGEPIRVAMLVGDGITVQEATSSVILDLAFEISAVVAFIISGIIIAVSEGLGGTKAIAGAGVFIIIIVAILLAFFWRLARGDGFFSAIMRIFRLHKAKKLKGMYDWLVETEGLMSKFFAGKKAKLALIVCLSIVMVSFKAIEAFFITHFFGVPISFRDGFLLATLPSLAMLLPVPGGLGVYEGSNAAVFSLLGLQLNAVAYTAIIRIRDFVFIMIGVTHAVRRGEKLIVSE
jgi:uncharacterized protein (TIRG00374 family)